MIGLYAPRTPRQHGDTLCHADCLADIVGHEDHGLGLASQNFRNLVGKRNPRLRIQRRKRLIEQNDIGLGAERARERRPLAHAAGKLARQVVQELAQPVTGQQPGGSFARLAHVHALDFSAKHRILQNCPPFEQIILLQHVADFAIGAANRPAIDQHLALRRREYSGDQGQQRALTAAAGADDGDELPRGDGERNVS